ncbi:MAG TPA: dihydrofolate reductase family protein [Kofleriaceae bacterium]|nr:dihydrofolate reductase family protein [Kofleriaceae bacterium]
MSKLVVTTFLSLDGVMQAPGGPDEDRSGGFELGGWTWPYMDDEGGRDVAEQYQAADGFLLGRVTYDIFAAYWPKVTDPNDPIAKVLNGRPKYVVSRTLERAQWQHTTVIRGDVIPQLRDLKDRPGRDILVPGSSELVQTLIRHDLVDEYRLMFFPVLLGKGKRLFGAGTVPTALSLVGSRQTAKGVLSNRYRRAGEIQVGSFIPPDTVRATPHGTTISSFGASAATRTGWSRSAGFPRSRSRRAPRDFPSRDT